MSWVNARIWLNSCRTAFPGTGEKKVQLGTGVGGIFSLDSGVVLGWLILTKLLPWKGIPRDRRNFHLFIIIGSAK